MASDYEAITEENIVRHGTDFQRIVRFLGEKLYGDRSHFIYELLQNAEDALSLRRQSEPGGKFSGDVTFRLCKDHLEVSHFGKLFDEEDVRAICGVLGDTKNERLDQIGTFGIGFKSVYAFTWSPVVHSGDEHFVIEQSDRPRAVSPRQLEDPTQTLFYFPFDHPDFSAECAFDLIQDKLKSLGPRSLLFLNHVKNIAWIIQGQSTGFYGRETYPDKDGSALVVIVGDGEGRDRAEEEWIILARDVQHADRPEILPVKMAYRIQPQREDKRRVAERLRRAFGILQLQYMGRSIQALSQSPLTAFFPTAKETNLGFLIHGPFASTPARDNIQSDSPWNDRLLSELATLVADSLAVCRRCGLLTADFLAALPIDAEDFSVGSPFRPIYDSVLNALKTEPLIPKADGGHAKASELFLGRSKELRDLLPATVLQRVASRSGESVPVCQGWVDPAITQNRLPKVWQYLRDECKVPVIDGEGFARSVTAAFLDARDDAWMVRFYSFLTGQEALWRAGGAYGYPPEGVLRKKPIIRCEDGQQRAPFDDSGNPVVFLPVESEADYPVVSKAIYRDEKAAEFMKRLGLVAPDLCTRVLNEVIPEYGDDCGVETSVHQRHLTMIRDAMSLKDSPRYAEMLKALKTTAWVLARNAANGEECHRRPTDLFSPSPNLETFFDGNEEIWFLAERDEEIDWPKLGVSSKLVIYCRGLRARRNCYIELYSSHGYHQRGWDGFDPGTRINGLDHALETITPQKAAYIWNLLLPPLIRFLHGRYQIATHQNYDNAETYAGDSALCKLLKKYAWVPVETGDFRKPSDCTVADLASELKRNDGLVQALGIKPDPAEVAQQATESQKTLVAQAGFSPELAALLVENRDVLTPEIIKHAMVARAYAEEGRPEFPQRPVRNPERRARKVGERAKNADRKTYDRRSRSVRTSMPSLDPSEWLRGQYTNHQDVMVCQICRQAMPFKRPDGRYYFEAVQISKELIVEEHTTYLALCPLCAAKYKVLVKNHKELVTAFVRDILDFSKLSIPVQSANGTMTVSFVETHLLDLQAALPNCMDETRA